MLFSDIRSVFSNPKSLRTFSKALSWLLLYAFPLLMQASFVHSINFFFKIFFVIRHFCSFICFVFVNFSLSLFPLTHSGSGISCIFLESGFRLSSKKAQRQFLSLSFYFREQRAIQTYPGVKLRHSLWRVSPQFGSGADFTVEFRTISLEEIFCTSGTDSPLISLAAVSARVSPKPL